MRRRSVFAATFCLMSVAACSDTVAPVRAARTVVSPAGKADLDQSEGRGVFNRYVAIGTSLSMGWQSDGVRAATQETSWPAQLAAMGHRSITQPYIEDPGCRSPLVAPLGGGVRLSGEPASLNPSLLSCAPLRADVVEPVQNLAINAALTRDALLTTPENTTDASNAKLISRVLQPGMTQVSSMIAQNPKLVSVEFGGNEILNARYGTAIEEEGGTLFPYAAWEPLYDQILNRVDEVAKEAVVVGLIDDVTQFPSFHGAEEIWLNKPAFALFNVNVDADCHNSPNIVFIPLFVPTALGTGAYYASHGFGPYTLHCASPDPTKEDYILTPDEVNRVNDLMARMDQHIRLEAERHNFAYFRLQALYGRPEVRVPFNLGAFLSSQQPYGDLISLDGVHPTAAGARILAEAAAQALDDRYNHNILASASLVANP